MLNAAFVDWIKNNLPLVIGIAAAVVVVVIVIIVLAVSARKKIRRDRESEDVEEDASSSDVESEPTLPENESEGNVDPEPSAAEPAANAEPAEEPPVTEEVSEEPPVDVAPEPSAAEEPPAEKSVGEKAPVAEASAEARSAAEPSRPRKAVGRWTIETKGEGEYMSKLSASNGEVMLSSEIYSSEDGARSGIATIIRCVSSGQFVIYRDKNGNYYYKLKTANNRLLCVGEIYKAKDQCERAVETVKRIAADAVISDELVKGEEYIKYVPLRSDDTVRTARGKWRIEKTEDGKFCAKLFASNGQLMLATEEVATRKSAENSITAVKRNAADGNFVIDRDKFGRYYYKLRNAAKSVICIGETYEKLDSCMKAIESVRRFAATAVTGTAE